MKARALIAALGIGLLFATSVRAAEEQPKTAGSTVTKIFDLLKAGNAKDAAKYFAGEDMTQELGQIAEAFKSGEIAASVADSKEDGDLAVVVVKATMKRDGQERTRCDSTELMRKNDMWQVYKDVQSMKLEGSAKEKMDALKKWADGRCAELNKADEKQPAK